LILVAVAVLDVGGNAENRATMAVMLAVFSVGSQTIRILLGAGRSLARRDQLRPVSADP